MLHRARTFKIKVKETLIRRQPQKILTISAFKIDYTSINLLALIWQAIQIDPARILQERILLWDFGCLFRHRSESLITVLLFHARNLFESVNHFSLLSVRHHFYILYRIDGVKFLECNPTLFYNGVNFNACNFSKRRGKKNAQSARVCREDFSEQNFASI